MVGDHFVRIPQVLLISVYNLTFGWIFKEIDGVWVHCLDLTRTRKRSSLGQNNGRISREEWRKICRR
jgi:hypothetical protein